MNVNVKKFTIPTFEDWAKNNYKFETSIGAFKIEITTFSYTKSSTEYIFACALSNTNPTNLFTEKLFSHIFEYDNKNVNDLKSWYDDTVDNFHKFWENYIKSVYLILEVKND